MMKATGAAYWACRSCVAYSQGITQKVKAVEKELEVIKTDVKSNKEGVKNVENSVEELKKLVEKNRLDIEDAVKAVERRMGSEWREREIRRKNVVIHRLPEPGPEFRTAEERRNQDLTACGRIFLTMGLNYMADEVKACRRLGEKGNEDRPLIVVLRSEESKRKILEKAWKLAETEFGETSIVPDMTPMQRKEEEELRIEADRKNAEELNETDRAKNLKWVVVGPKGEKRLIKTVDRGGYRGRGRGPMSGISRMEDSRLLRPSAESERRSLNPEQWRPESASGRVLRTPPQGRGQRRGRESEEEEMNPAKR